MSEEMQQNENSEMTQVEEVSAEGGKGPQAPAKGGKGSVGAHGNERTRRMGTASVPLLLLEFAIPSIIGMLVNGFYNVISAAFLGQAVGSVGLAVTTAAFPITIIFMALAMLVGNGGNALAALRLGEGRRDEAELTLGNTVTLAIIIAVVIAVVTSIPPCMDALLVLSSATDPEISEHTRIYVWILSLGVIFQIVGMGINNFIRTAGAPNRALVTMVVGAVSCIVFNYLFVMVFGWGIPGSALATILGQAVSCISVLWYFLFTPGVPMQIKKSCMKLEGPVVKEIITLGMASFLLQICNSISNLVVNHQLVFYGDLSMLGAQNAMAAIGVVGRLAGISFMPIIGVSVAAQPLLGFNYGAGNIARVKKTLGFAILYATIIGTLLWGITRLWPYEIVGLFGVESDLLDLTVYVLHVQMLLMPVIGFQICTSNYFQATGQPIKSIALSLTRQLLFLIPALLLLPIVGPMIVDVDGLGALFASWPTADFLAVFTAVAFLVLELRRLGRIERGEIKDRFVGEGL